MNAIVAHPQVAEFVVKLEVGVQDERKNFLIARHDFEVTVRPEIQKHTSFAAIQTRCAKLAEQAYAKVLWKKIEENVKLAAKLDKCDWNIYTKVRSVKEKEPEKQAA
jgi:ribosomal protein S24E